MNLLAGVVLAICFFLILLGSGSRVFGAILGSPMRGAVVPMLVIPLVTDWIRFILHVSPAASLAAAVAMYLVAAALFFLRFRPRGPFSLMEPASRRHWLLALTCFFICHAVIRTWIVTGSVPNPADDGYSGYKANALINSPSWPTMLPETAELPMAYYYYAYEWPAGLSSWAGVPLKAGWWVTAILQCVTGTMLILELVLPNLRTRRDLILGSLIILNGCSVSFLAAAVFGLSPKYWTQEAGILGSRFHLYLRVPQFNGGYWSPFANFSEGLLLVAIVFFWRLICERRLKRAEYIFLVLVIASLAGYCTFELIGFVLVIVPVLTAAAIVVQRRAVVRHWLAPLVPVGVGSLILCFPVVMLLIHRVPGARQERFKDPLLVWLQNDLPHYGFGVLVGLLLWTVFVAALSNLAIFPVLFPGRKEPRQPFTTLLLWIFGFGTFVCLFGIIDDFVPKFGGVVAAVAVLAFYTMNNPPKWSVPLLICGVIGPCLGILNTVRANIALQKMDPVWRTLDQLDAQKHEVVLYDIPTSERKQRLIWVNIAPYFSRIHFLEPADQVDDQAQNFMVDPAQLKTLPPTPERVREFANGSPTYLLLRTGTAAPAGERLYSDGLFSIDRVKVE